MQFFLAVGMLRGRQNSSDGGTKEIKVTMNAQVDEIVGFLASRIPDALRELQARYHGSPAADLFLPGTELGPELQHEWGLRKAKAEAAVAALAEVGEVVTEHVAITKSKLARANNWETVGSAIALVGTVATLGVLLPEQPDKVHARTASALALVGSLLTLLVKSLRKTLSGSADNIAKPLSDLQDAWLRAEQLLPVLRYGLADENALSMAEIEKAIADANDLIRKVRGLLLDFGA
jgi:hypothetical protein